VDNRWWLHPDHESKRCRELTQDGSRCKGLEVGDGRCKRHPPGSVSGPRTTRHDNRRPAERQYAKAAPLEPGLKFGAMQVVKPISTGTYLCICACGAMEKRSRTVILSAKAAGRASACKKCVKVNQHKTLSGLAVSVFKGNNA
jgi:hypothetical protein